MVIERFQLLDEVVQLDESPEGLALVRSVDGRGEELQHGVVLTVSLLTHLKEQKNKRKIDVFPHKHLRSEKQRSTHWSCPPY